MTDKLGAGGFHTGHAGKSGGFDYDLRDIPEPPFGMTARAHPEVRDGVEAGGATMGQCAGYCGSLAQYHVEYGNAPEEVLDLCEDHLKLLAKDTPYLRVTDIEQPAKTETGTEPQEAQGEVLSAEAVEALREAWRVDIERLEGK